MTKGDGSMGNSVYGKLQFLVLMLVLVVASALGKAEEAAAPIVRDIRIVGAMQNTPQEIKAKMRTREGHPLDRKVLDEDFQRLFKMGPFADVQIKENPVEGEPDKVDLIVLVREKNIIRRIVFRGNERVKTKKLEDKIQSKAGARFDEGQVARDARAIEEWYKDEYYYFAQVTTEKEPFEDGIRLVFNVEEGGKMYVRKITFRGNEHIKDKELLKYMQTRSGSLFSRGKYDRENFERDLERVKLYYQSKGYLDVRVVERPFSITENDPEAKKQKNRAEIIIDIEEGQQYKVGKIDFDGNGLVDELTLRGVLKTMPGEIFSPQTVEEDAGHIRDVYGAYPNSRYFTKVWSERVLTEENDVIDVVFHVKEGLEVVIEDVQIIGNRKTKDAIFRREITQLPGEKIDSAKINQSKANLMNLNYTNPEKTTFKVEPVLEDGQTDETQTQRGRVVVSLEEAATGKLSFGAGYTERLGVFGEVKLEQRNFDYQDWPTSFKEFLTGKSFMGSGQNLALSARFGSESQSYSFGWSNPWIFNKPILFGFKTYYDTQTWDTYDENDLGGKVYVGKYLWKRLWGQITYKLDNIEISDVDDDASTYIKNQEGEMVLSRTIYDLSWSTINSKWDPTKGYKLALSQEVVGGPFAGDADFFRSFLTAQWYHPFYTDKQGRPWVFSITSQVGYVDPFGDTDKDSMPLYEKLYAGGLSTLRGFDSYSVSPRSDGDAIGGLYRQTNQFEFWVPVYEKMVRASAFYDVGGVWDEYGGDDGSYRSSVGLGLHVKTPLFPMPIRIYWAHALNSEEEDDENSFHVNIFESQF